jgi:hypothetical protein
MTMWELITERWLSWAGSCSVCRLRVDQVRPGATRGARELQRGVGGVSLIVLAGTSIRQRATALAAALPLALVGFAGFALAGFA